MKKLLCVLLVLILALTCVSCSSEPAVVWGEAAGVTTDAFTTTLNEMQMCFVCGTESYTQEVCVTEILCTENYISIDIDTKNYVVEDALLFGGDMSDLRKHNHFEQIANSYSDIGFSSSRHYRENDDGTAECTIEYRGINNVSEYGCFTLVLDDGEGRSPMVMLLNIENYGKMKTVDIVNRRGDVIGQAHISAMYAELYIYPEKFENTDKLFIVTADGKTAVFENVEPIFDGHNLRLNFRDVLDIDAVDHLLYKG